MELQIPIKKYDESKNYIHLLYNDEEEKISREEMRLSWIEARKYTQTMG